MDNYQYNAIKAIYGKDTITNLVTNSDIDNFYKYNHRINANGINIHDKVCINNNYHAFSSYIESNDNSPNNYPRMSINEYEKYKDLYKPLKGKDIDWDNAYLKYLSVQKDYDQPITYKNIDMNTGSLEQTEHYNHDYIFNKGLSESNYKINSTYELINIIDYLIIKYHSLKFEMNNLKQQLSDKEEYNRTHQNN